jgi:hypothetical protein
MALVRQNIVMQGLSGTLGEQLVIKVAKGGRTIVSVKPTFDENRAFSAAQQEQQQAFREAVAYAKEQKDNQIYIAKAEGTSKNAYNLAMADWFHAPEILEINLDGWSGEAGQVLRIRVQDDVQVQHVEVMIMDEADTLLEQGSAVDVGALWWEYTTTGTASGNPKVVVAALDIPEHMTQVTEQKALGG